MSKPTNSSLEENVPPATRLAQKEQAKQGLQLARDLLHAKRYKEAFKRYKETLANAEGVDVFPSEREMKQLAKNYRPALVALKQWRNQKEKLILAQTADSAIFSQWGVLNKCLNDKDRIMQIFQQLREANADASDGPLRHVYWKVWPVLAKRKQYEELRPFLGTLGWMTFLEVAEYHSHLYFPQARTGYCSPEKIVEKGALVFEVALAVGEGAQAIADKLLSVDESDATYAALIRGARRAGFKDEARALYERAKQRLGTRRFRKSTKAMGPLAKSRRH